MVSRKEWVEAKLTEDPDYFKKLGKTGGSKHVKKGFALIDGTKHRKISAKGGKAGKGKPKTL